jgi:capsule polysaccharide export protein KpsE/RkpR
MADTPVSDGVIRVIAAYQQELATLREQLAATKAVANHQTELVVDLTTERDQALAELAECRRDNRQLLAACVAVRECNYLDAHCTEEQWITTVQQLESAIDAAMAREDKPNE